MSSSWRSRSNSEDGRAPSLGAAVVLALAAAVAGCTAFDVFQAPAEKPVGAAVAPKPVPAAAAARIAFNHKFHLGRGVSCEDCHVDVDKSDKAPMPTVESCMECHSEFDPEKPKEKTVAAFLDKDGKTPIWSKVTAQSADIVFSHRTHLAKKVACAECHQGIEESEAVSRALFVDMDACMKCHEAKQAKNDCATCHQAAKKAMAESGAPYWAPANHQDAAWRAAHGPLALSTGPKARAERCDDCHGKQGFPARGNCDVCHAATRPANHDKLWTGLHGKVVTRDPSAAGGRCAYCHDKPAFPERATCDVCHVATKPANHEKLWTDLHGQAVRSDPSVVTGKCAFCHDRPSFPAEAKCTGCHMTEPPRDHSESWRVGGGHGLAAALDRARCDACHTPDTCSTCHQTAMPRNHRGNWGAPKSRHCVNCHLPLSSSSQDGCATCHEGTPSHQSAPRMPSSPPHTPDMTCRKCHSRLEHADNGTNCVTCHR
jgi:c(7)-type cytochrome triheme protein